MYGRGYEFDSYPQLDYNMIEILKILACIAGAFAMYISIHYIFTGNAAMFMAIFPLSGFFVWWYTKYMLNSRA